MLHEFVTSNRQELISRCRTSVAKRFAPTGIPSALDHGVPLFLQQLAETLRHEQTTSVRVSSETGPTDIGRSAAVHGAELLRLGFSVDQVVHEYGDVCQSVTALAVELAEPISTDEFRTLNRCLDDAIADAVASFEYANQTSLDRQTDTMQERLAAFSLEHRRLIGIAVRALAAIRTGNIGISGATGTLLAHALEELDSLVDRSLPELRLASPNAKAVSR